MTAHALQNPQPFDPDNASNSVSVIIPVYNGARFIAQTLESILNQTAHPGEVIIIDDGSTDNTASVVRDFGESVILINTRNGGANRARNIGASRATGSWIAPCDGDDLWLPTKLEKQLRLAHEVPEIHCVLTDYADFSGHVLAKRSHLSYTPPDFWIPEQHPSGFVIRKSITGKLTTFQPSITSVALVRRTFYEQIGGFDETPLGPADDTCFHFRCLCNVPFGVVPEVLMHYRRHPDSLSANSLQQLENSILVWKHIIHTYPQAEPYRSELLRGLAVMRSEFKTAGRYRRRQVVKRFFLALEQRLGRSGEI